MTSRRSLLAGLPAAGAMALLPAAVAAAPAADPAGRVFRLMEELSAALDDYPFGQFRAIVEPSTSATSVAQLQNMGHAVPTWGTRMARIEEPVGCANIDGERVLFDHAAAPAISRVTHEDTGLVAHCSHPEPGAQWVVFDEWGQLHVSGLRQHADYARIAAHPRMGFFADQSSRGREYVRPVLVIGKVIERRKPKSS